MQVILGIIAVISVISIIVTYKWFFIGLAVVGIGGFVGYKVYKKKKEAKEVVMKPEEKQKICETQFIPAVRTNVTPSAVSHGAVDSSEENKLSTQPDSNSSPDSPAAPEIAYQPILVTSDALAIPQPEDKKTYSAFIPSLPKQSHHTTAPALQSEHQKPERKWDKKLGVWVSPLEGCTQTVLHGAGMEHHLDDLMALATENADYTCTKWELKKFLLINERVFQFKFTPKEIDLVPDPENKYDANAVKIFLDGHMVAYVRKEEAPGAADLFNSEKVKRVQVSITGGPYKILLGRGAYFDGSEPITDFELEKDTAPYSIKIFLDIEDDTPCAPAPPVPVKTAPVPKLPTKNAKQYAKQEKSASAFWGDYILNTDTKTVHKGSCRYVKGQYGSNFERTDDLYEAMRKGYKRCKNCNP